MSMHLAHWPPLPPGCLTEKISLISIKGLLLAADIDCSNIIVVSRWIEVRQVD